MEQLFDNPIALTVIAAVALLAAGRYIWHRRRESALRSHAHERGWWTADDAEGFADLVTREFPELRDEAEQQARAARRTGPRRGGAGVNVSLASAGSTRSRARARSVYVVPVEGDELAVGEVAVTGTTGKLAQGRSTVHRGALATRLPGPLPSLKLLSRDWIDRDTRGDLPQQLREQFNDVEVDAAARETYLDSGAWKALLEAPEQTDGIAIDGDQLVLLSRKRLTPERVDALADTARRLVAATSMGADDDSASGPRLSDPLSPR